MVQLSEHFQLPEFEKDDKIPAECIPTFAMMCVEILEPVREYIGSMLWITSGYRSPDANFAAHGQPNSEHMATKDWCACDFFCVQVPKVFDWMRSNPILPYHQLILEKGKVGYVIHVSFNKAKVGIRSVKVGATNNSQPYQDVAFVAYNPNAEINA